MKKVFGLIGKKLSHSFSKGYFENKFKIEGLSNCSYNLYELQLIDDVKSVFDQKHLVGLNVTVPYKEAIIPFLDRLDRSAEKIGAVNVVKIFNGSKIGFNSDYYGFRESLVNWIDHTPKQALILGTGGASKAVAAVLTDVGIQYKLVSREKSKDQITYNALSKEIIQAHKLIINTTPLGMSPNEDECPMLPYQYLSGDHFLYDLIYNPEVTKFLRKGQEQGSRIKNGLEMLQLQADKSWEIWNQE